MTKRSVILIVEDEPKIGDIMQAYFERARYVVARAHNGEQAIHLFRSVAPDLVILDLRLPKRDGLQVLREIRELADTPTILVTALGEEGQRLTGFNAGADDYVVKPFNPCELVARARAVLRRTQKPEKLRVLKAGRLEIDLSRHVVLVWQRGAAKMIDVTATQFKLLARLAEVAPRVLERSDLMTSCLPESDAVERTIDSHLSKLRRRLDDAGATGVLENVRGVGYRLRIP